MKTFWTEEKLNELKALAAEGASANRAAARLGRSSKVVRLRAKELGIQLKGEGEVRRSNGLSTNWVENRQS